MYFNILSFAITILLFFRILSYLKKILPFSKTIKHYSGFILPVIELVSWLGFLIWCLHKIYQAEAYPTLVVLGIIIVLLLAPTWFLVRDFLFGLVLKIQRKIEIDSKIEIGELKGTIVKTDYFTFDIKTENEDIKTIPYNKIRAEIISKNVANNNLERQTLSFQIKSKQSITQILSELKITLINAPWVTGTQEPTINLVNSETDNYLIEAVVFILKKEHATKIEAYVKNNFIEKLDIYLE
jgi:hypothetical protein